MVKSRIKPLRPSLQEKKRYIVFEIICKANFGFEEVKKSIIDSCLRYLGEFGYAKANVYVIRNTYIPNKNRGIIRVANKKVDDVKAALLMITNINNKKVIFRTLGVSGIIKKAKNKFLFKENKI